MELIGTEIILKLPIVPLEKLIVFIASLNFWGSIAATFVGIIIGLILTAIIFSENLKVVITDSNMSLIKGDNTNIVIDKQDISSVYIEDKTLVILGLAGEELYRGTFDRNSDTAQDAFLYHHYPWRDKDSFIHEYQKWNLEHKP
ncbi:YqeB family protein [Lentibacillus halodurans]|uniref:YqeB family protein n=1 Tax=Lentibacillus halodurans TaxID=237679 RepID=UPI003CC7AA9B